MEEETREDEPTFQTYGFDIFIGRAIDDDGSIHVGSFDLHSLGSYSCNCGYDAEGLKFAFHQLLTYAGEPYECLRRKILLSKSPGRIGLEEKLVPHIADVAKQMLGEPITTIRNVWIVTPQRVFKTFSPVELKKLQKMYERKCEKTQKLRRFPNPFLYQPE